MKVIMSKVKRQKTNWEKIFIFCLTDKILCPKYIKSQQIDDKYASIPI